jgi:hypothetical protein
MKAFLKDFCKDHTDIGPLKKVPSINLIKERRKMKLGKKTKKCMVQ